MLMGSAWSYRLQCGLGQMGERVDDEEATTRRVGCPDSCPDKIGVDGEPVAVELRKIGRRMKRRGIGR